MGTLIKLSLILPWWCCFSNENLLWLSDKARGALLLTQRYIRSLNLAVHKRQKKRKTLSTSQTFQELLLLCLTTTLKRKIQERRNIYDNIEYMQTTLIISNSWNKIKQGDISECTVISFWDCVFTLVSKLTFS